MTSTVNSMALSLAWQDGFVHDRGENRAHILGEKYASRYALFAPERMPWQLAVGDAGSVMHLPSQTGDVQDYFGVHPCDKPVWEDLLQPCM